LRFRLRIVVIGTAVKDAATWREENFMVFKRKYRSLFRTGNYLVGSLLTGRQAYEVLKECKCNDHIQEGSRGKVVG
jgi:hypothetical protein